MILIAHLVSGTDWPLSSICTARRQLARCCRMVGSPCAAAPAETAANRRVRRRLRVIRNEAYETRGVATPLDGGYELARTPTVEPTGARRQRQNLYTAGASALHEASAVPHPAWAQSRHGPAPWVFVTSRTGERPLAIDSFGPHYQHVVSDREPNPPTEEGRHTSLWKVRCATRQQD
jgi:hypothetical protein